MTGNTGVTPVDSKHHVTLTTRQIETIISALRMDFREAAKLGALPIGEELQADIQDAYQAVRSQSR
jgi:hypothetical protein